MINERLQGVLNWYKENTSSNPNMFELVEVLCRASRDDTRNVELIKELTRLEVERLITNGIVLSEDDSLVQMILEIYEQVLGDHEISEDKENYLKTVAGVTFWLKTLEVNGQRATYDNVEEYTRLMDYKYTLMNKGETISDTCLRNEDFISLRYKNDRYERANEWNQLGARIDTSLPIDEKIDYAMNLIKPYVYPERLQVLSEICHKNKGCPMNITLNSIRDLAIGVDFDTVIKKIGDAHLSGLGESLEMGTIAHNAKCGPEFYMYAMQKRGIKIPNEYMEYLNKLKEENMELANKEKDSKQVSHHLL